MIMIDYSNGDTALKFAYSFLDYGVSVTDFYRCGSRDTDTNLNRICFYKFGGSNVLSFLKTVKVYLTKCSFSHPVRRHFSLPNLMSKFAHENFFWTTCDFGIGSSAAKLNTSHGQLGLHFCIKLWNHC